MKKRAITAATYNVIVQVGSLIGSRTSPCIEVTCIASITDGFSRNLSGRRCSILLPREQGPHLYLRAFLSHLRRAKGTAEDVQPEEGEGVEVDDGRGEGGVPGRPRDEGEGGKQAAGFQVQILAFDVWEVQCHTSRVVAI